MMSIEEYLQTPETVLPRELAFGVMRVADAPVVRHQRVVRDLTIALTAFVRAEGLGEVRYGVKECWLIDLARRQVAVLAFEDGKVRDRGLFIDVDAIASAVLPGLRLTPFDLFGYV